MKFNILFCTFLMILVWQCASSKFNKIVADGLEASIDLERDTFLLGEPFFATFNLFNGSEIDVEIDQSDGYFVGGRIDNFDVKILNQSQDTLESVRMYCSKKIDIYNRLYSNSSEQYPLFIPFWSEIKKPGKYQINASKNIKISTKLRDENDDTIPEKYIKIISKAAKASFIIMEDSLKLGQYINNLIKEIEDETKGRFVTYWGIEVGEENYIPLSKKLTENMKILEYIEDPRIIPFLARSYKNNMNLERYQIITLLRKFSNDSTVFNIMKLAANDVCTVSEENLELAYSTHEMRQSAIYIIMSKNNDEVLQYIISKENKDCPFERYLILLDAKKVFDKERLIKLCKAYINDENKYVREKAIEILNEIKSE